VPTDTLRYRFVALNEMGRVVMDAGGCGWNPHVRNGTFLGYSDQRDFSGIMFGNKNKVSFGILLTYSYLCG